MIRIKELRREQGISQIALASAIGVHQTAVSQWETGRTVPDMDSIQRLAKYFGVSVDYILGRPAQNDELDEIYLNLARAARDRELKLDKSDIDFILDFAQQLKARDKRK